MITKENAKEWLPLVQALAEGKRIEQFWFQSSGGGNWREVKDFSPHNAPEEYRIAPEPKRVPLTVDDIPAVCWVMWLDGRAHLVTSVCGDSVLVNDEWVSFDSLQEEAAQYSTDRKTWKPCWKEVVA